MTGLAFSRQSCTARFCTSGTWSSGSSTPRSPRATMTPSKATTIASRWSTASGFSTLARTGRAAPSSSMIWCTSLMSSGERTNDSAIRSTPRPSAKRRSSSSLSDIAGTLTATLGSETPLLLETGPPSTTRQRMSLPSTRGDLDGDLAVVDQQPVADLDLLRQLAVGAGDPVRGAEDVVAGDGHDVAGAPARAGRRRTGRGGSSDPAGRPGRRRRGRSPRRPARTRS